MRSSLHMRLRTGHVVILSKWLFTRHFTSAAIDLTNRCNLKCAHCYWWKQDHPLELDDRQMLAFMRQLRRSGLRAAILYGGEPTLRPAICRAAGRIFDATLAFTNGTNGFPDIGNGQWVLSLDGPREVNDALRGKGVYDLAVGNLMRAPKPPLVHMTISRMNQDHVGRFVREMVKLPVRGIGFSFFTPERGSLGADYTIPLAERDLIVVELLRLRKTCGKLVGFTPAMAQQLLTRGGYARWNNRSSCPVTKRVRCFKSNGEPKACTYGDEADCSRCGCAAVVAYRGAFYPLDLKTLRVILRLLVPQSHGVKKASMGPSRL
jgi:MoaA/NifB/PqqE/SkfB family radical SAM enzyme